MIEMQHEQNQIFEAIEYEIQRLQRSGLTPRLFAYNPAPHCPFGEFNLAIDLSANTDGSGFRDIIRIGSYWLVPAVLERLKRLDPVTPYDLAQFLFALQEFCPDVSATDWLYSPDAIENS